MKNAPEQLSIPPMPKTLTTLKVCDAYRPCYVIIERKYSEGRIVREKKKRALFHGWTQEQNTTGPDILAGEYVAKQYSTTRAIVELEDGAVRCARPEAIQFIDTRESIDAYDWSKEEKKNAAN